MGLKLLYSWTPKRYEKWAKIWLPLWRVLEQEKPNDYHDGIQWITFLQHTPEQERASAYWPMVEVWLSRPGMIERDPEAEGYVHKVLEWAPTKGSYANKVISEAEWRGWVTVNRLKTLKSYGIL